MILFHKLGFAEKSPTSPLKFCIADSNMEVKSKELALLELVTIL